MRPRADVRSGLFPEIGAGGFTRIDGTVEFYGRIRALVRPEFRVLDFGAGLGDWIKLPEHDPRKTLRLLRGSVREIVGCDIDPRVCTNPTVDRAVVADAQLPFETGTFDLVISDFVFEHVDAPEVASRELSRVLRPGGWLCARTPNKWSYVSLATRMIPNTWHKAVLRKVQPDRPNPDAYPTRFRLNTRGAIRRHFPGFDDFTYFYQPEPAYYFGSGALLRVMRGVDRLLPDALAANLFVFLRKRQ